MVRVTINYGYDIHHIDMDENTYAAIRDGQEITLVGQGFVHEEDVKVADYWHFNRGTPGEMSPSTMAASSMLKSFGPTLHLRQSADSEKVDRDEELAGSRNASHPAKLHPPRDSSRFIQR